MTELEEIRRNIITAYLLNQISLRDVIWLLMVYR